MDNRENLLGVIETIFRWKKPIIILCLLVGIGSVIITLLLPNYYKSSTLYYVANPDLALPEPVGNRLKEKTLYGRDSDIDRNLTIARSSQLVDYMVKKYNLYSHYDMDSTNVKAPFKVRERFLKLYQVQKTKYDAVELSVEDEDRELAAQMVNDARKQVELISRNLIKEGLGQQLETYQANLKNKEQQLVTLGDSLQGVRQKYGAYNTESQSEGLALLVATAESKLALNRAKLKALQSIPNIKRDTITLLKAYVSGIENELAHSKASLNKLNEGMASADGLTRAYKDAADQFSLDTERYKQLKIAYEAEPPVLYIVEEGTVPVVKSRPKRSIICLAAFLATFIFSVIAVLILDAYKDVNWKAIVNAR